MSKTKAPGVIPGWAKDYNDMTPDQKAAIAAYVGVGERTVWNWAHGKRNPSRASQEAIKRAFKRMGGRA